VELRRGEIWWADLADPVGSAPGFRRPVLIVQSDAFSRSRLGTITVVALTRNLRLVAAPGNLLLTAKHSGLRADSVVNVTQVLTIDRRVLTERIGMLRPAEVDQVDAGLRLALGL